MNEDKNCGVCIHSDEAFGRECEHPQILRGARTKTVTVGVARSAMSSPCGPDAKLFEPCDCLEPFCVRHGKDKRR